MSGNRGAHLPLQVPLQVPLQTWPLLCSIMKMYFFMMNVINVKKSNLNWKNPQFLHHSFFKHYFVSLIMQDASKTENLKSPDRSYRFYNCSQGMTCFLQIFDLKTILPINYITYVLQPPPPLKEFATCYIFVYCIISPIK